MDDALAGRVRRAARAKGMTESEFMREAIEGRAQEALGEDEGSFYDRTRHLILPSTGTELREKAPDFGDIVQEKHARIVEGYRRRTQTRRDPAVG
jgi:hypothetical protein